MKALALFIATLLVFQGAASSFLAVPPPQDVDDKTKVLLILKGVVEGLAIQSQIDIDSIKSCINNSKTVVTDLVKAVKLIESNTFANVKEGIRLIGEAIQVLPDAVDACHSTEQELIQVAKTITALLEQMRHPLTFGFIVGKNLVVNGREIFHETYQAISDYKNQNYEQFGVNVGKILYTLFLGKVQEYDALDASFSTTIQVFQGVLIGFYEAGGVKIEDVQSCVFGTEQVVTDFIGAVQLILTRDSKNVREGLRLLGMGLQILPQAITTCQGSIAAMQKLSKQLSQTIASLESPQTFAFHVGVDLIVNGRDIYREINDAVVDWNNENYMGFGENVGKALYQIFVGVQQQMTV